MTMPCHIRPEVLDFKPYSPGLSIDEIRERFGLSTVIKMASNENPLGVSPEVSRVLQKKAAYAFRYPQSGNPRLVEAIAGHHGVTPDRIVVGNGSDEVIDLLLRVCPTPGVHSVVMSRPCFSLYRLQSKLCGVSMRQVPLRPDFSFDWEKLREAVDATTALVFLTTPDNPSGYCPPAADVADLARSLPKGCLLVIDEAYMDFCDHEASSSLLSSLDAFPNVVILRTFSKSFGLAGLRVGYGIMPPALAGMLCRVRLPFSVNLLAEEAGIAALGDTVFREATLATVALGRRFLSEELATAGCQVHPSQANFLMFSLPGNASLCAQEVFEALLRTGVIIRPLASYGLPDKLRVSVGTPEENRVFIHRLREVLGA